MLVDAVHLVVCAADPYAAASRVALMVRRVLFASVAPLLVIDALLTGWAFGRLILG